MRAQLLSPGQGLPAFSDASPRRCRCPGACAATSRCYSMSAGRVAPTSISQLSMCPCLCTLSSRKPSFPVPPGGPPLPQGHRRLGGHPDGPQAVRAPCRLPLAQCVVSPPRPPGFPPPPQPPHRRPPRPPNPPPTHPPTHTPSLQQRAGGHRPDGHHRHCWLCLGGHDCGVGARAGPVGQACRHVQLRLPATAACSASTPVTSTPGLSKRPATACCSPGPPPPAGCLA